MDELTEELARDLEEAVHVKNRDSLMRYTRRLVESTVGRYEHEAAQNRIDASFAELKSEVALIAERMDQGFKRMDERFAANDKRFESVDMRFEAMDKRFETMDKRFDDLIHNMDKRFEAVDKRFESLDGRFTQLNVTMTVMFTVVAALIAVFNVFL